MRPIAIHAHHISRPGRLVRDERPRLTLAATLCQPFAATFLTAACLRDWAQGRSPCCGLRPGRAELPGPKRRNSTPAACRWNRCAPPPETPGRFSCWRNG